MRTAVVFWGALTAACATTGARHAADPSYERGKASFAAARWSDVHQELSAFIESSCVSARAPECHNALWMSAQAHLHVGQPAHAILDCNIATALGPPVHHFGPSFDALMEQAVAEVSALRGSPERTARLEASYRNDVGRMCRLDSFAFSLDLGGEQPVPLDRLDGRTALFDPMVAPGDHHLAVVGRFKCPYRGGEVTVESRSSRAYLITPKEPVRILIRSYELEHLPPLAAPFERLALDFTSL